MAPKILLFKAPSDNDSTNVDSYEEFLGRSGIDAVSIPVLQFQFINIDKLAEKLGQPNSYSGLVFTSPRSVEAVQMCLLDHQTDIAPWTKLVTYVVGKATGQLVDQKLHLQSRGQDSGNAAVLAQYIVNDNLLNKGKPLLFPSADIKRDTLPSALKAAEVPLDSTTVYETKIRTDLASSLQNYFDSTLPKPEALVFFSPSGVTGVCDAFEGISVPITDFKLFAIGPSTREALKSRNLEVAGTAAKPNVQCLLESLQNSGIFGEKSYTVKPAYNEFHGTEK